MTTSRIIQREFVVQSGDDTLPAVTLDYAWSSFMNTYAVWPAGAGDRVTIRRNIALQAGNYYVTGAVDNYGSVSINGQNISLYNFDANISRTSVGNSAVVNHPGGTMTIVISATNTGGPRGVAVTISQYKQEAINLYSQPVGVPGRELIGTTSGPPYVGDLVWSTRSPGTATVARYQVTMPFRANITAHAWGAGGGGGGNDAGTVGGVGAPGLYNTTSFIVERGDLLEVFVGTGGTGGVNGGGYQLGGRSGSSRIDINGNSVTSFNGGVGGNIIGGRKASSGSGGGGGGASGVLVNNIPAIVAGGGGGGGGAGNDGNSSNNYSRRDASIANNANSASGPDFRGENGQDKSGDGGGGGGGGGGYPGGQGGSTPGGDISAYAGQCGGNYPVRTPLPGEIKSLNGVTYSLGGDRSGGNGLSGLVILSIEPLSLISVKVAGEWKQINEGFVKVGGSWRDIDTVYVKIDDLWREVNGAGQGDVTLAGNTQNYGTSTRSYT